jgi:hypothetical protein
MQIRLTVEIFPDADTDKQEIKTDTVATPIAQGIIVGDLNLPKIYPLTVKMSNLLGDVKAAIYADSMPDPRETTDAH